MTLGRLICFKTRPTLAFLGFVVGLVLLRQASFAQYLLVDVDLGWHLAYGNQILETRAIPRFDAWSWTMPGEPYRLTQWGGEVLLALAYQWGYTGLSWATAATVAATFMLVFATVRRAGVEFQFAAVAAVVAPLTIWAAPVRPVIFGWLMSAAVGYCLMRICRERSGKRYLAAVVIAMGVWTNLHGSFALGAAIVVGVLFCEAVSLWLSGERKRSLLCLGTAAASVVATLANPYGAGAWESIVKVAQLETTRYWILEWQPTRPWSPLGAPLLILCASVLFLAWRAAIDAKAMLGGVALLVVGLMATRNVPMVSILGAMYVGRALQAAETRNVRSGQQCGRAVVWASGLFVVLGLVAALNSSMPGDREVESLRYPVKSAEFLDAQKVSGKLFNDYDHGGWWILRHARWKVMIDGRADMHPDSRYADTLRIMDLKPGWEKAFDGLDVDVVVIRSQAALREALRLRGDFALVHEADGFSTFLKQSQRHADTIRAHKIDADDGDPKTWSLRSLKSN
jgi:hypothetical protein